jgi:hypothetical protein
MFHVTTTTTTTTDNVEYSQTPETLGVATRGFVRGVGNQMTHYPGGTGVTGHGFKFPQTGIYTIESTHRFRSDLTQANSDHNVQVQMSNDSSSTWQTIKELTAWHPDQSESTSQLFHTLHGKTTVRISNTTTERVRFKYNTGTSLNGLIGGNSAHSYVFFIRVGLPGEKGATGDKGQKGEVGSTGPSGSPSSIAGPTGPTGPSVLMGTYVFANQFLAATATGWATDEDPPTGSNVDITGGYSGDLTNLEFITPGAFSGIQITSSSTMSFPKTNASDELTLGTGDDAHNNIFGYVIPAAGTVLGFTVDLIGKPGSKPEFYVFVYDPTPSTPTASFVGPITSTKVIENYASAYKFDEDGKTPTCKAGNYLFAVQTKGGSQGLVHITAYIRYEK